MQKTPLHSEYAAHGAKVVDFHGWSLPVQFEGILAEHRHTREYAGLFDCSHMSEFLVTGEASLRAFDHLVFSDMMSLRPGRCRYSGILDPNGRMLDDCVALRLSADELYVVTNAGTHETIRNLLMERIPQVDDLREQTAKIDIQGPESREVLLDMGLDAVAPLTFWAGTRATWRDTEIIITRAGYTGELGYELFVPNDLARPLWRMLSEHPSVAPCGLGARDTLRLEAGLTLYGEDVTDGNTPLEASLERFIAWEKDFQGKDALVAQAETGGYPRLTGIRSFSRRAPRHGYELRHEGVPVGHVTSGTFGPSVGYGVGFAYVASDMAAPGTSLTAGPRGLEVETAQIPLFKDGTSRIKVTP